MLKLKALLLTQGMHGMISQVEGLAKALGLSFRHETIQLKKFWNFFPPKFTPVNEGILKKKFICDTKVIISCGRKSVVPSILLKRRFKKEVFNIHIQDPKVNLSNFDSIICPEHDNLHGENVIKTKGAIHYLTNHEIQKNINYLKPKEGEKKIVTFIIGGPNKYYSFSEKQIDKMFAKIKNMFISTKYKLIIIPSCRTPENIVIPIFPIERRCSGMSGSQHVHLAGFIDPFLRQDLCCFPFDLFRATLFQHTQKTLA